jgi:hypothetical protein
MNKVNEAILDISVKKSLGYSVKEAEKWSIVACAKNRYLKEGYDPFYAFKMQLIGMAARVSRGIGTN